MRNCYRLQSIFRNKDIIATVTKDPMYVAMVAVYVGYVDYDCYAGVVSVWN